MKRGLGPPVATWPAAMLAVMLAVLVLMAGCTHAGSNTTALASTATETTATETTASKSAASPTTVPPTTVPQTTAFTGASRSTAPLSTPVLGGSGGEQSVAPRTTIITTPSGKLSSPASVVEVPGSCPYISNADFKEFEGDRVGRVVLLQTKPVGCRFYFANQPDQIIGEVLLQSFATKRTAFNTVALSGQGHPEVQSNPALGDGAVAFRTELQGQATWQCVFALGTRVFTVRTRQPSPAIDAFNLAAAVLKTVR